MPENIPTTEILANVAETALKLSPLPAWVTTIGVPVVRKLITDFPHLRAEIVALFSKDEVTEADWKALHDRIAQASYEKLVPHSGLNAPDGQVVVHVPAEDVPEGGA